MNFLIVGDVHGDLMYCRRLCLAHPHLTVLQLGDLGLGNADATGGLFDESAIITTAWLSPKAVASLPSNFRFFCGNHDNRSEANKLPNCLGDYGDYNGLFFLSGAQSYDKDSRIEGVSWWPDEEISYAQGMDALKAWEKSPSNILVAHDAPQGFVEKYYGIRETSRTRQLLQRMVEVKKPKLFIAGHHHRSLRQNDNGIQYQILGIGETVELTSRYE